MEDSSSSTFHRRRNKGNRSSGSNGGSSGGGGGGSGSSSTHDVSSASTNLHVSSGEDDTAPTERTDSEIRRQKRKRRQRAKGTMDEPPFWKIVLQVGMTLLVVCVVLQFVYRRLYPYDPNAGIVEEIVYIVDDDVDNSSNSHKEGGTDGASDGNRHPRPLSHDTSSSPDYTEKDEAHLAILSKQKKQHTTIKDEEAEQEDETSKVPETVPPLPHFELSDAAAWDVFGITNQTLPSSASPPRSSTFWQVARGLRQQFADRYGTENAARMLLDKGLTTFATSHGNRIPIDSIHATACRFQAAQQEYRPFRVAFGGYSVTAGRGNTFEQSFPFQFQRILETAVKMVGIPGLQVVNAAIGGSPAFPYGWCMTNFWDTSPDVVSWDYSMNEAAGVPEGLEAYIRHLIATYPNNVPKLIVKDTYLAAPRRDILGQYLDWLQDPVVLHTGPAIKPFLERSDAHNPVGFQEWRKFGAPEGAPGQALHHPALKEHELMGWMLAMHFLTALEYMESRTADDFKCPVRSSITALPPPVTGHNTTTYDGILFGHSQTNTDKWRMNPIHCRTTFQPLINGDLTELVVSGTTAEDLDIALPKSQMYYNRGWTYDLSDEERQMKRKLSLYENELGFVDSKEAYYGIFESPLMQVLVPYTATGNETLPHVGQKASDWFESIVVCQVHEKRGPTACNTGSDVAFTVGGANATFYMMKDTGTLYLGKPVCAKISIPANATLTSHNTLASSPEQHVKIDQVGLLLAINVTNTRIAHINQACSVSHIVWEQGLADRRTSDHDPNVLSAIE